MLESTQDILEAVNPLLDAGDTDSAGRLLMTLDSTSLRALLLHILKERGTAVAEAVGATYVRESAGR